MDAFESILSILYASSNDEQGKHITGGLLISSGIFLMMIGLVIYTVPINKENEIE